MVRIKDHPILGALEETQEITIFVDGKPVLARAGEPIASALAAQGIRVFRNTANRKEPRGLFCAIGRCTDCMMTVNGIPNIRTCITPVREGMQVETQDGLGRWLNDG